MVFGGDSPVPVSVSMSESIELDGSGLARAAVLSPLDSTSCRCRHAVVNCRRCASDCVPGRVGGNVGGVCGGAVSIIRLRRTAYLPLGLKVSRSVRVVYLGLFGVERQPVMYV